MSDAELAEVIAFDIIDSTITEMSIAYGALTVKDIDDKEGLKAVHDARMVVRDHRVGIEKQRKALKAKALEFGKKVDAEADRITRLLVPLEQRLQAEEDKVAEEKERRKQAEIQAKKDKLDERMRLIAETGVQAQPSVVEAMTEGEFNKALEGAKAHAAEQLAKKLAQERLEQEQREEQERQRDAERAAMERQRNELADERRQLEERQKLEREARAAEQAKIDEEKEKLRAAREKLDAEQRKVEDERKAALHAKELEEARAKAAKEATERAAAETKRKAEEKERREQAEKEKAARREARRPEADRLKDLAKRLQTQDFDGFSCEKELKGIYYTAGNSVLGVANRLLES